MKESRLREESERTALVVSVWNATTSGLMDSSAAQRSPWPLSADADWRRERSPKDLDLLQTEEDEYV